MPFSTSSVMPTTTNLGQGVVGVVEALKPYAQQSVMVRVPPTSLCARCIYIVYDQRKRMPEPKTQCSECGCQILQRTANECDGLCVPCAAAKRPVPPENPPIRENVN